MKKSFALSLMVLLALFGGDGFAGGMRNFADSWPIGATTARRLLLKPTQVAGNGHGFLVKAGQGRLFEMSDLEQRFLAFEGRLSGEKIIMEGGALWERTGSDLFKEDQWDCWVLFGENPSWGMAAHHWHQTLGGVSEPPLLEGGLLWELVFQWGEINGRFHLEWPLGVASQILGGRRRRNLLNLTLANKVLAASLVLDRQDDGTPRPGFHFLLALDQGIGVEFRVDPSTGSLGPGLAFARRKLMVRTSHIIHPHLGVTHRLMLVMGQSGGGV